MRLESKETHKWRLQDPTQRFNEWNFKFVLLMNEC